MSRADLEAEIASYKHRKDAEFLAAIPGFIDKSTRRLGRELRVNENMTTESAQIDTVPYTLPATFRKMARVRAKADGGPITLSSASGHRFTRYARTGTPSVYEIVGYTLDIRPFSARQYELRYWHEPAALDTAESTNPVLDAYDYLYLYASLIEANIWCEDYEAVDRTLGVFTAEVRALNTNAKWAAVGDAPAAMGA